MIEDFIFGNIVIIGDLLLDCYINGSVGRISPEAPIPVLLRASHTAVAGGAANVAMNAATLGSSVSLVGLLGLDAAGRSLKDVLSRAPNIDLTHLVEDSEWTTITKTRVISGRQQIVRIDEERIAPLSKTTTAQIISNARRAILKADVVVCSDYAKGVLSDEVLAEIISAANARDIPVVVDPKRKDLSVYKGAYLITPNRSELHLATGSSLATDNEVEVAAAEATALFGGNVLVTRSEEGMSLCRNDGTALHIRAHKSEVYDVSGAGDTVVATIASILAAGQNLETAVVIATAAASIAVSKLGTATVSKSELSSALRADMGTAGSTMRLQDARQIIDHWRHHGARIVFTNGCFDLIHPGHIALLKAAAREGDKLVVAINSDASVKRLKGESRPLQDEQARATVMSALRDVDLVIIFDEDTPLETIKALRPDIVVKGADYNEEEVVGGDFVKSYGGKVILADLIAGRSTSAIVKKMSNAPLT